MSRCSTRPSNDVGCSNCGCPAGMTHDEWATQKRVEDLKSVGGRNEVRKNLEAIDCTTVVIHSEDCTCVRCLCSLLSLSLAAADALERERNEALGEYAPANHRQMMAAFREQLNFAHEEIERLTAKVEEAEGERDAAITFNKGWTQEIRDEFYATVAKQRAALNEKYQAALKVVEAARRRRVAPGMPYREGHAFQEVLARATEEYVEGHRLGNAFSCSWWDDNSTCNCGEHELTAAFEDFDSTR